MTDYPRRRAMTGVYYPVWRDGKFVSIDVSDLIEEEIRSVLETKSQKDIINLAVTLTNVIKDCGEKYQVPFVKTRDELRAEEKEGEG